MRQLYQGAQVSSVTKRPRSARCGELRKFDTESARSMRISLLSKTGGAHDAPASVPTSEAHFQAAPPRSQKTDAFAKKTPLRSCVPQDRSGVLAVGRDWREKGRTPIRKVFDQFSCGGGAKNRMLSHGRLSRGNAPPLVNYWLRSPELNGRTRCACARFRRRAR